MNHILKAYPFITILSSILGLPILDLGGKKCLIKFHSSSENSLNSKKNEKCLSRHYPLNNIEINGELRQYFQYLNAYIDNIVCLKNKELIAKVYIQYAK